MTDEYEFPPHGPVPYEKRRPLRPWNLESEPLERPMLSQPITSYKLLNRSTEQEKPERAAGDKNRLTRARPDFGPTRERIAPPAVDELKRQIDEEESNRLNVFDGYNPTPPRPREGFGLQLRPQHNDINEYFTGPKWDDPRGIQRSPPYLEVVETRPIRIPPPAIIKKPKPYREIGEKVVRPQPKPAAPKVPPKFSAKNILFHAYDYEEWVNGGPAKFRGNDYLRDIQRVADILRDNPNVKVRIRASVASDGRFMLSKITEKNRQDWIKGTMIRRGQAVANHLNARGIDPKRISTELGYVGSEDEDRKVEFIFDAPAP